MGFGKWQRVETEATFANEPQMGAPFSIELTWTETMKRLLDLCVQEYDAW